MMKKNYLRLPSHYTDDHLNFNLKNSFYNFYFNSNNNIQLSHKGVYQNEYELNLAVVNYSNKNYKARI